MANFFSKLKGVLTQPTKFYKSVLKEKGVGPAFLYYLVFFVLSFALFTIAYYVGEAGKMYQDINLSYPILLLFFILGLIVLFIITGILHGFFKLVSGKGKFEDTFKTYVYAATPSMIFGLIYYLVMIFVNLNENVALSLALSLVTLLLLIWTAFLMVIGGSILHKISKGKAFLAGVILPAVLMLVLVVFFAFIAVFFGFLFAASI
ncbi:Yip1 family protein [Nanoarchaeota archaeon]